MSHFKVRVEVAGGHVHCAVFVAQWPDTTYANCGTIVVDRGSQFSDLRLYFQAAHWEGDLDEAYSA